jgi:RNA polymerase sigma factor (sigma-70 family)
MSEIRNKLENYRLEKAELEYRKDAAEHILESVSGIQNSLWKGEHNAKTGWYSNHVAEVVEQVQKRVDDVAEQTKALYASFKENEQAIMGLEPKYRAVLVLRYLHGLSWPKVADKLEVPLRTVQRWHEKAMDLLEKEEKDDG